MFSTEASGSRQIVGVGGRRLEISNLGQVLYPATGFTKGQVLDYYARVAPAMLPHLEGRPVAMRRFPDGVEAPSSFEKNVPRGAPQWIRTITVPRDGLLTAPASDRDRPMIDYTLVDDLASLMWVASLAALELHVPQWRVDAEGRPAPADLLVLDLDPGAPATMVECCAVALLARTHLESDGLTPIPKTSGSKGLHVYARITNAKIDDPSGYACSLTERLQRESPDLVVSYGPREQGKGKVLIDWDQNRRAKVTTAPYSLRGRSRETISTPVTWAEVEAVLRSEDAASLTFGPDTVLERLRKLGDLFSPLLADPN
jgi:bifunctional non-homologous end joining protein LigD